MPYDIDSEGNIVWVEDEPTGGQRVYGLINERTPLGQAILANRAAGRPGLLAPPPPGTPAYEESLVAQEEVPGRLSWEDVSRYVPYSGLYSDDLAPTTLSAPQAPAPISFSLEDEESLAEALSLALGAGDSTVTGGGPTGYSPSFVDLTAAEAMLPLTQTPEEEAALQQMLADLQQRGEQGIQAVRSGWEGVRAVNQAAADKARRMAAEAGPEAARLWVDAANNALTFARQTADAFTNMAGMQRVNISPTGGAQNIASLLAAQAPRARSFAERMGLVSAQDIASQARTAAMMGEAYAGEITRTVLQQAQEARAAHNQRVLDRIAANRQTIAGLRASAATTNAQIANSAAQFAATQAAARARTPEQRIAAVETFYDLVDKLAVNPQGASMLINAYPELSPAAANQILEAQRQGTLERMREEGLVEAEIRTAAGG